LRTPTVQKGMVGGKFLWNKHTRLGRHSRSTSRSAEGEERGVKGLEVSKEKLIVSRNQKESEGFGKGRILMGNLEVIRVLN